MIRTRHVEDLFDIANEDIDNVKKIICEDEEKLQHVENLLHEWIQCDPHMPKNYDRGMMRSFVRGAKFNAEIARRKLEGYFFAKFAYPRFYRDRDPGCEEISKICEILNVVRMPRLTENGERICILALSKADPDVEGFDMVAAIKLFWMMYDLSLTCTFPTSGEILIFDAAHASSRVLAQFLTPCFKNAISVLRHAYAIRLSQLHVVNCPTMAERVVAAVRPLLHEKVKQRFVVHKNLESLQDYLHPALLPSDYGGRLQSLRSYMKRWTRILLENKDWFQEQESVMILGKPPKIHKFSSDFSVEGSFRQLNID